MNRQRIWIKRACAPPAVITELRGNDTAVEESRARLSRGPVIRVYGARDERHNQAAALREFLIQGAG